jgi:hypothetical protein
MTSTRLVIGVIAVLLCSVLMISNPQVAQASPENQPEMRAAMDHLRQAQRNLESASHDKGGHRAKALEHVRQAIAEVELGIQYDNRH